MIFWPVLYFGLYVYYLLKAYNFVHAAPWSDFKIANLMVRLHVRPSLLLEIWGEKNPLSFVSLVFVLLEIPAGADRERRKKPLVVCFPCLCSFGDPRGC